MLSSDLYKICEMMPKGGVHNFHLNGAIPAEVLLKMTYENCVYFSQRQKYFKIARVRLIISMRRPIRVPLFRKTATFSVWRSESFGVQLKGLIT